MNYRSVSTALWTDDTILSMSPEQKLLLLYLHTNPYASACGIYRMQVRTMAFQVGLTSDPFEGALRGLAFAFPDFVAVDLDTMEVALLQYPKQTLLAANSRVMKHVSAEIEKVESQFLLRELIARNSATISKPYVSQLRRLQMKTINTENHGDVLQMTESQQNTWKREIEIEIETNSLSEREEISENFPNASAAKPTKSKKGQGVDFQEYMDAVQLTYPVLYGSASKILLRAQYKAIMAYIARQPAETKSHIMGLVWNAHELMNKDEYRRKEYGAVSMLVNNRFRAFKYPTIEEMDEITRSH